MKILYTKKNIPEQTLSRIKEISELPSVKEVIAFPDVHLKEKYANLGYRVDIPSSLAILTEDCLYPQFRSRGINCGMALIKTNLFQESSVIEKIEKVILEINKGIIKGLFNKMNFPLWDKYSLSEKEYRQVCLTGSEQIANKYHLNPKFIFGSSYKFNQTKENNFDSRGIKESWLKGRPYLKRAIGKYFGGNHFLEIQVVDDIYDQQKANQWQIEKGQICIMYHTAGESLNSILEESVLMEIIYQPKFIRLNKDSNYYSIVLNALKMLMNYGFAYRMTTFAILNDLLPKYFGNQLKLDYFIDQPHNSVEQIEKEQSKTEFIYRHNLNKVVEDQPVILSGSYNLRSYINQGGSAAKEYLWSADHGYGDLTKYFPITKEKQQKDKIKRILFKKGINHPLFIEKKEIDLEKSEAANQLLSILEENNISKKVFSLKPIVNLGFI